MRLHSRRCLQGDPGPRTKSGAGEQIELPETGPMTRIHSALDAAFATVPFGYTRGGTASTVPLPFGKPSCE